MNWLSDVVPAPSLLVLPPDAVSLDEAHAAIELWEFYSGKTLDPTQRLTVEMMMAESASGRWAARTTGREMPRQNGKGDELEVVELWGLTQRGEAILHTAHELITVSSAHERMVGLLSHRDLSRRTGQILNGLGQQMIRMTNGAVIAYRTRTKGGGRGLDDISRLVIDEAQHAQPEQLASSTPTLLANPNPQMNFAGTGGIAGVSDWWWQIRCRALNGGDGAFGYVGHTADDVSLDGAGNVIQHPIDPTVRDLWFAANPALHAGRGEIEFFEEQVRNLGPALFAREHLGVWDPPSAGASVGPIDPARWAALETGEIADDQQDVRLALDCPPDRMSATFAIAGRLESGESHVQVRHHVRPSEMGGLVDLAKALAVGHGCPVVVPPGSPVLAWKAELAEAGVDLDVLTPAEYAEACGLIQAKVIEGSLSQRPSDELSNAVAGLAVRSSGDVDVWSRRHSSVNIAPFVAVTCALVRVPEKAEVDVAEASVVFS